MPNVKIIGMGRYLPKNKVSSSELDAKLQLAEGSVQKKSGLISRHFAAADETTSYMGAQAARIAVEKAGINLTDVDAIISACGVGEQAIPCTAALFQQQLGLESSGIACFDVNSTCLSFITALDIASHLLAGGRFKRILIVSSEIASVGLNWQDMETCTIFGDGAAACVVEQSEGGERVLAAHHETYSIGANICKLEACGTRVPNPTIEQSQFYMEGKKVFKLASKLLDSLLENLLNKAQVSLSDVHWIIPHQASLLAMQHIQKRLNIPQEKYVSIYPYHGNQIAASIPTALCHLIDSQQLQRGQLVLLLGTGAGLAAGGLILEY
ncbi:beta-ketoacyl-ACP synthase III [Legionella saoudiensis]|uniref:beta-ketoacyl-ACP synthase III n=1 Tax=Legionella saoudiensis TaxID=1750561 RepID=UPI000730C0ED|nr:beta-ketoacyl-ACP synthase III [Legionella saoudiensis]